MHIQLNDQNKDKVLEAVGKLGLSAGEIVNRILTAVELIEFEQILKFTPKPNAEDSRSKPIIKRHKFSIRVKI